MPLYSAPMSRTGAQLMILTLLVGLFLMQQSRLAPTNAVEESFADFLAMNSHRTEAPAAITLVGINRSSMKEHPWPWSPLRFAQYFEAANSFKPEVVSTDAILDWREQAQNPDEPGVSDQYENILRDHLLRAPKVLLGATLGFPEDPDLPLPAESVPALRHVEGDLGSVPDFTVISERPAEKFRLSSVTGFVNLLGEANWYRSVPLVLRYRGQVVPSFVLQAVLMWEKLTLDDVRVVIGSHVDVGGRVRIPIDGAGQMRVDFGVPRGHCGFDDLVFSSIQRSAQSETHIPEQAFAGKFLFLSRVDPESQTLRLAAGRYGSPGELIAAAIGTIQSRTFIRRAPYGVEAGIIGLGMLLSLWLPRWRKAYVTFCAVLLLLFYILAALWVFGLELIWMPILVPVGLTLFLIIYRAAIPGTEGALPRAKRIV